MHQQAIATIEAVRKNAPLVHNITNFVVMQVTANSLLAAGASPLMAHAPEELEDLLNIASALVLNIGTLSKEWINSMAQAGAYAHSKKIPVVLDPVGAGASRFRTQSAHHLVESTNPDIVRGNASEIMALASAVCGTSAARSKGVDSLNTADEALQSAVNLAQSVGCVVSVSGERDCITDGKTFVRVHGGTPMMTLVTGLGCSATALTGAYAAGALASGNTILVGAVTAMAVMAEAGDRALIGCKGPGSFLPAFLDALYTLDPEAVARHIHLAPSL